MKILYVGKKPSKNDTVAGTGLVWAPGQVHEVTDEAAVRLLKHPDVWAVADNWRNADGLALVNGEDQKTARQMLDELAARQDARQEGKGGMTLGEAQDAGLVKFASETVQVVVDPAHEKAYIDGVAAPMPVTVDELRAALTAKGITFHHKAGPEKLAALLAEATKGE